MFRERLICLVALMGVFTVPTAFAGDPAQAMADRLSKSLDFEGTLGTYRIVKHGEIAINVEPRHRRANICFAGNKMLMLKAKISDTETSEISIGDNIIELTAEGKQPMIVNKAARTLSVKDQKGRWKRFARVAVKSKSGGILQIVLQAHDDIKFSVSSKGNGDFYFGGSKVFSLKGRDFPLRGNPKNAIIEFSGVDRDRKLYFNRARKVLYWRGVPEAKSRFATVDDSPMKESAERSALGRQYAEIKKKFLAVGPVAEGAISFVDKSEGGPHWIWRYKIYGRTVTKKLNKEQAQYITECIQRNDRFLKLIKELRQAAGKTIDYELEQLGKTPRF